MPTVPSQVLRDLNLNSGDAVELCAAEDILRVALTVDITPGSAPEVNRDFSDLTINREFVGESVDRARQGQRSILAGMISKDATGQFITHDTHDGSFTPNQLIRQKDPSVLLQAKIAPMSKQEKARVMEDFKTRLSRLAYAEMDKRIKTK